MYPKIYKSFVNLFTNIKNFFFCIRYPFWKVRNPFGKKSLDYSWLEYDMIPEGWQKAFGKQLSKDLRKVLKKEKCLHSFYFMDIKEKYGSLRLDGAFTTEKIDEVLDYYELLSMCYCLYCGKPVRYISKGWINYLCEDCAKEYIKPEYLKECRTTYKDIPVISTGYYDKVAQKFISQKKPLPINFKEKWDLN